MAKSGDDGLRWRGVTREAPPHRCIGGRCGMVCDGDGVGGGGEIYTGCQPPNNVIALYKLRERGEHGGAH